LAWFKTYEFIYGASPAAGCAARAREHFTRARARCASNDRRARETREQIEARARDVREQGQRARPTRARANKLSTRANKLSKSQISSPNPLLESLFARARVGRVRARSRAHLGLARAPRARAPLFGRASRARAPVVARAPRARTCEMLARLRAHDFNRKCFICFKKWQYILYYGYVYTVASMLLIFPCVRLHCVSSGSKTCLDYVWPVNVFMLSVWAILPAQVSLPSLVEVFGLLHSWVGSPSRPLNEDHVDLVWESPYKFGAPDCILGPDLGSILVLVLGFIFGHRLGPLQYTFIQRESWVFNICILTRCRAYPSCKMSHDCSASRPLAPGAAKTCVLGSCIKAGFIQGSWWENSVELHIQSSSSSSSSSSSGLSSYSYSYSYSLALIDSDYGRMCPDSEYVYRCMRVSSLKLKLRGVVTVINGIKRVGCYSILMEFLFHHLDKIAKHH